MAQIGDSLVFTVESRFTGNIRDLVFGESEPVRVTLSFSGSPRVQSESWPVVWDMRGHFAGRAERPFCFCGACCLPLLGFREGPTVFYTAKQTPGSFVLTVGWSHLAMCPVAALRPQPLRVGVEVMGSMGYPAPPHPLGPDADGRCLCRLCCQIFGIFLARTLISDIEAVKAGHHF